MADKGNSNTIMGFILLNDGIAMMLVSALADVIGLGRSPGFGILQMEGALLGASVSVVGQFVLYRPRTRVRVVGIKLAGVGIVFLGLIHTARIFGFALIIQQIGISGAAAICILAEFLVYKRSIGRLVSRLLLIIMATISKMLQLLSSGGRLTRYFLGGTMSKILQLLSLSRRLMRRLTFLGSPKQYFITIRFFAIIGIILWLLVPNVVRLGKGAVHSIYSISKNWSLSYEEKMRSRWGHTYNYLTFVNDHTPSTAVIMRPPQQNPWLAIGNGGLIQYFLYPRRHHAPNPKKDELGDYFTHILVAWGKWNPPNRRMYGWPKFPVNVRKFHYMPRKRKCTVDSLLAASSLARVNSKTYPENSSYSSELLENYISDSDKEVNDHRLVMSDDRLVENIEQTYTSSNFDYWMKAYDAPLDKGIMVKARIMANIRGSVNLVTEVRYDNGKSAIFSSAPNKERNSWEFLLIDDLYEKAKNYGLLRDWGTKKMRVARIGVNTGHPLPLPYLEKYGVIELERGQERRKIDLEVDCAPKFLSLGSFYRARDQIEDAIASYQFAEKLEPANPWIHCNLGDMFKKKGEMGQAKAEYKRAVELAPDVAWFHFALGEVYEQEGKVDLAIESLEKAVKLDPDNSLAYNILGEIYMQRRKGKEAYAYLAAGSRRRAIPGYYQCQEKVEKISSIGKDLLQRVMENPQEKKSYYRLWKDYYGFFGLPEKSIEKDGIFDVHSLKMRLVGYRGVKIEEKGRTIYPQQYDKPGKVVFAIDVPDELIELVIKPDLAVVHKESYARIYLSKDGIDYELIYTQNGASPKTYSSSEIDATEFAKDSHRVFFKIELFVDGTTSTSLKDSRIGGNFQVWAVNI